MSVEIDPKNVDPKNYQYLLDRPWMIDEFRRQGYNDEMDAVSAKSSSHPAEPTLVTTEKMRVGSQTPQHPNPQPNGPVEDDVDYNEWSVSDLKTEIDARNAEEGRQEKLSSSGNKAALVAVLEDDDIAEASA